VWAVPDMVLSSHDHKLWIGPKVVKIIKIRELMKTCGVEKWINREIKLIAKVE